MCALFKKGYRAQKSAGIRGSKSTALNVRLIRQKTHVTLVYAFKLYEVEHCATFMHPGKVEVFHKFSKSELFSVGSWVPTEQCQVVYDRFWKESFFSVLLNCCAVLSL